MLYIYFTVMCKIIWHLDLNQTHAKVFGYQILYSLGKVWHLLGTVIAQPLPMSCYVVGVKTFFNLIN